MVTVNSSKMAKSAGNLVLVSDLLAEHPAAVVRLMILDRPWQQSWDYYHPRPLSVDLDVPAALDVAIDTGGEAARLLLSAPGLTWQFGFGVLCGWSDQLHMVRVGDGVVDAESHAGVDGELVEVVRVDPGGVDHFVVVRAGLSGSGGGVQAERELLAYLTVGVDHDVAGVGVDAGQAGDGDCQAGLLGDFADGRVGGRFAGFDLAAGEFPVACVGAAHQQNAPGGIPHGREGGRSHRVRRRCGGIVVVLSHASHTGQPGATDHCAAAELSWAAQIHRVDNSNTASAVNLVHYWALRQCDLRGLQRRLAVFGLSSLGRTEAHVQASLDAIATAAAALLGQPERAGGEAAGPAVGFADGARLLRGHTTALLGREPDGRATRIMVTLPSEAAADSGLVRALVEHGMDLARINCAHDDPGAWAAMITHVRQASAAIGRPCRIAMDLAGPKLRTGPLVDGPRVVRLRPMRNALGRVTAPAWCWLTGADNPSPPPRPGLPVLPVPKAWLARLRAGVEITLVDTRAARRRLLVRRRQQRL